MCQLETEKNEKNTTQIDDVKDLDVIMPMYSLIEYSDSYLKNIWNFMAVLQKWTCHKWLWRYC